MSQNPSRMRTLLLIAAVLACGIFIGVFIAGRRDLPVAQPDAPVATPKLARLDSLSGPTAAVQPASPNAPGHAHKVYACPMHPDVISDHAGRCPICGMDLVQLERPVRHAELAGAAEGDPNVIRIAPQVVNNLGVRTEKVRREDIGRSAHIPAYIQGFQPGEILVVRSPLAGTVVAMRALAGSRAHLGEVLLEIEVPGRREAQAEHLRLLAQGDPARQEESRQRLRELGFTGDEIQRLEQERTPAPTFKVMASKDGQIIAVQMRQGDKVRPGMPLLSLQSKGETAVDVDIFQNQAMWMKSGDVAQLRVRQLPGKVWTGSVAMEGLRVNPEKRTYSVRLLFPMDDNAFAPDMFAEVWVTGASRRRVLTIPQEALIRTEGRNRVVLALGDGRFKPVEVVPGVENNERVEIVSGLHDGDEVVVSAQFLLDSESSMRAEIQRMTAPH